MNFFRREPERDVPDLIVPEDIIFSEEAKENVMPDAFLFINPKKGGDRYSFISIHAPIEVLEVLKSKLSPENGVSKSSIFDTGVNMSIYPLQTADDRGLYYFILAYVYLLYKDEGFGVVNTKLTDWEAIQDLFQQGLDKEEAVQIAACYQSLISNQD